MFFPSLIVLLAVAIAAVFAGRQRSVALAGEHLNSLHSRPGHYGLWLAMCGFVPAFLILCLWSLVQPGFERWRILGTLTAQTQGLTDLQRDALWSDVTALAAGSARSAVDALREQAAQALNALRSGLHLILGGLMALAVLAGLAYGWRAITPAFRARHRVERFATILMLASAGVAVLTTIGIVFSLVVEALRFFSMVSPFDFLFGLTWTPQQMALRADQAGGTAAFGFLPLLSGTLLITVIAMAVAAPLGLLAAVYLSEYAGPKQRAIGKPLLELLAGIPTVVYGFFAALTVAPLVRDAGQALGLEVASESALAAGLVMGIMIVPFVSSLCDDVINAVPQALRDGSTGLGSTPSETIRKVVLPAALPGIVSALVLAFSRAIGETMIVVMAAGLAAKLTFNPLEAVTTITVQISTLLTGDQEFDSPKTLAAFGLGLVLFIITLGLNFIALKVINTYREAYD